MKNNYIDDRYIKRYQIASDIKKRILKKKDINDLCDDLIKLYKLDKIEIPFDDKPFTKESKSNWNEKYLTTLVNKTTVEIFNREYLLYINDVAEYLHKKGEIMRTFIFCCVFFVLGGCAGFFAQKDRTDRIIKTSNAEIIKVKKEKDQEIEKLQKDLSDKETVKNIEDTINELKVDIKNLTDKLDEYTAKKDAGSASKSKK